MLLLSHMVKGNGFRIITENKMVLTKRLEKVLQICKSNHIKILKTAQLIWFSTLGKVQIGSGMVLGYFIFRF